MKKLLALFVVIFISCSYSQNYKQVEIFLDKSTDIETLLRAGMEFDHLETTKNNSIITFISDKDYSILESTGFNYKILIDDWYKYYESLPQLSPAEKERFIDESKSSYNVSGFGFGSMGGHYTLAEVWQELDSMYMLFPNLITQKMQIGVTENGRPLYAVKISDNPDVSENEPRVSFSALTHAREPQGMMTLIYYMYYLLENYGSNPEVTYLVNNREIFFVPVVNPDGYEYNRSTNPNGGGMWRKNRRNNGSYYGVDLNRNWGPYAYWNAPNGGSSTSPSSDTYRGTAPFSEPETGAVKNFIAEKSIKSALNYHTYGNLHIFPYGALSHETPDSLIFREYAADMTQFNHYEVGTDLQTVGYSTRGNSDDYMYDGDTVLNGGKIFAMTPEVGTSSDGGFWALQTRIFPLAQDNLFPNLYCTWIAGEYVSLKNPNFDRMYFLPGDTIAMQPVFKNKGLSAANNLNFEVVSLNPDAIVLNGNAVIGFLDSRSEGMVAQPMQVILNPNTPVEHEIRLLVTSSLGGNIMARDTVSFVVGMPVYAFADTSNAIPTYWNVSASPTSSPVWETTTSAFYSQPNSYTDSKIGNYIASATVTLSSKSNIDLSGFLNPRLTFWMKHDIEAQWDCGVVLASTNEGSTWTPLQGTFSRSASGSGKQVPAGMPCYDGSRLNWVKEEINLSAFGGQQIRLRFELRTDGSIQKDGWYIDDIGIYYYGAVPVELTSFNASVTGDKVLLDWSTATETNNKGFEIERAPATGNPSLIKDWTVIGFVSGKGTTAGNSSYSFTDNNPLTGKIYYRLKQIDYDGSFVYYNPVEVTFDKALSYSLEQNYPNPFNPQTTINYEVKSSGKVLIRIYDIIGNEIARLVDENQEAGSYSVNFDASNLPSGVYIYTIKVNDFVQSRKMTLLK